MNNWLNFTMNSEYQNQTPPPSRPSVTAGRQEPHTIQLVEKRSDASFHNRWLSDTILDTTQAVLKQQFLHDKGMQSVLYAEKTELNLYLEDLFK